MGIRIHIRAWICMFLGLPDAHPDPLVKVRIRLRIRIQLRILPASSKNSKISSVLRLLYDFLLLFRIRIRIRIRMFLGIPDPHPDPSQNVIGSPTLVSSSEFHSQFGSGYRIKLFLNQETWKLTNKVPYHYFRSICRHIIVPKLEGNLTKILKFFKTISITHDGTCL